MTKKKNKFFTLIFSMMFGAGQMYMGFMKQGVSIMAATAVIFFTGSWLNIGPVMFALPVLWFYSFFDSINKMSLSDEKFQELEDQFLFLPNSDHILIKKLYSKYETIIAMLLILIGVSVLGENVLDYLSSQISNYPQLFAFVNSLRWNASRILFAVVIIVIGVKMIIGKKTELDSDNSKIESKSASSLSQYSSNQIMIKEKESDENA